MKGQVELKLHYIVSNIVQLPLGKDKYEKQTKSLLIKRIVRTVSPTQMFGFEEIINLQLTRIFTARVIGKEPAKLLIVQRPKFIEFFTSKDLKKLHKATSLYTDLMELGK